MPYKTKKLSQPLSSKVVEEEILDLNDQTKKISLEDQSSGYGNSVSGGSQSFNASDYSESPLSELISKQLFYDQLEDSAFSSIDLYFETFHKTKRSLGTSSNTLALLAKLKIKKPEVTDESDNFLMVNESFFSNHSQQLQSASKFYQSQYNQWLYELTNGYNLLFYGYGSKKSALYNFCYSFLCDNYNPLIAINGYYPNLNFRSILETIVLDVLAIPKTDLKTKSFLGLVNEIKSYFSKSPDNRRIQSLNLLIHNIDGSSLRKESIQSHLSILSSIPEVHLIASIDHINAPLLWDSTKLQENGYNFIWHNLTTFDDYIEETSFENQHVLRPQQISNSRVQSLDVSSMVNTTTSAANNNISLVGVQHVMASLTSNAKNIFIKLANFQISALDAAGGPKNQGAKKNSISDIGMEYFQLYNLCKESFLVSNEITFRSLLTEFRDHGIITFTTDLDGSQSLHIPLSISDLKSLLEDE
ncbi:hypothetical protein BB560_004890 [Smittium megazygosporum]|uniref:Origin recognition complex subunit 2 n=1 Tax=Smittium megazygosporum TaxID=133381 RepID=A0A2T9Z860_9FUNG|nr:hypothetical protein BB560_004890 [Smittium megazygosporum]